METDLPVVGSVVNWLRAGYPQGIPTEDYIALFAVLHRKLTEYEVGVLVDQLIAEDTDGKISRERIEEVIRDLAHERPGEDDVARVAARLAAGGWPLADVAGG